MKKLTFPDRLLISSFYILIFYILVFLYNIFINTPACLTIKLADNYNGSSAHVSVNDYWHGEVTQKPVYLDCEDEVLYLEVKFSDGRILKAESSYHTDFETHEFIIGDGIAYINGDSIIEYIF